MTETLRDPFLSWIKDYKPGKDIKVCLIKYDPLSFTNVETEAHKSLNLMCKLPYLVTLDPRLSHQASLVAWMVKNLLTIPETWVLFLGQEDPLEKGMATHSSILAWRIPWTEEPGGLQSMGSLRGGHDWATSLSLFTFTQWRRQWQPTPVFLPGESHGQRRLVGYSPWGLTESDTTEWLNWTELNVNFWASQAVLVV